MLPAADVVGVDVLASPSVSSSKRVCSGLGAERIGGGGARRLFERLFRNISGPRPVPLNRCRKCFNLSSLRLVCVKNDQFYLKMMVMVESMLHWVLEQLLVNWQYSLQ